MTEGMSLQDAEDIVMEGDKNRSRQVRNWREKGLFPYGVVDNLDGISSRGEMDTEVSAKPSTIPHRVASVVDEDALLNRLLSRLDEDTLLMLTAARQGINLEDLKNMRPRLKKSGRRGYPTSLRFHEELILRVKAKLTKDGEKESLTGLIERLLFTYLGEPADLLDEGDFFQHKLRLYLKRLEKKENNKG